MTTRFNTSSIDDSIIIDDDDDDYIPINFNDNNKHTNNLNTQHINLSHHNSRPPPQNTTKNITSTVNNNKIDQFDGDTTNNHTNPQQHLNSQTKQKSTKTPNTHQTNPNQSRISLSSLNHSPATTNNPFLNISTGNISKQSDTNSMFVNNYSYDYDDAFNIDLDNDFDDHNEHGFDFGPALGSYGNQNNHNNTNNNNNNNPTTNNHFDQDTSTRNKAELAYNQNKHNKHNMKPTNNNDSHGSTQHSQRNATNHSQQQQQQQSQQRQQHQKTQNKPKNQQPRIVVEEDFDDIFQFDVFDDDSIDNTVDVSLNTKHQYTKNNGNDLHSDTNDHTNDKNNNNNNNNNNLSPNTHPNNNNTSQLSSSYQPRPNTQSQQSHHNTNSTRYNNTNMSFDQNNFSFDQLLDVDFDSDLEEEFTLRRSSRHGSNNSSFNRNNSINTNNNDDNENKNDNTDNTVHNNNNNINKNNQGKNKTPPTHNNEDISNNDAHSTPKANKKANFRIHTSPLRSVAKRDQYSAKLLLLPQHNPTDLQFASLVERAEYSLPTTQDFMTLSLNQSSSTTVSDKNDEHGHNNDDVYENTSDDLDEEVDVNQFNNSKLSRVRTKVLKSKDNKKNCHDNDSDDNGSDGDDDAQSDHKRNNNDKNVTTQSSSIQSLNESDKNPQASPQLQQYQPPTTCLEEDMFQQPISSNQHLSFDASSLSLMKDSSVGYTDKQNQALSSLDMFTSQSIGTPTRSSNNSSHDLTTPSHNVNITSGDNNDDKMTPTSTPAKTKKVQMSLSKPIKSGLGKYNLDDDDDDDDVVQQDNSIDKQTNSNLSLRQTESISSVNAIVNAINRYHSLEPYRPEGFLSSLNDSLGPPPLEPYTPQDSPVKSNSSLQITSSQYSNATNSPKKNKNITIPSSVIKKTTATSINITTPLKTTLNPNYVHSLTKTNPNLPRQRITMLQNDNEDSSHLSLQDSDSETNTVQDKLPHFSTSSFQQLQKPKLPILNLTLAPTMITPIKKNSLYTRKLNPTTTPTRIEKPSSNVQPIAVSDSLILFTDDDDNDDGIDAKNDDADELTKPTNKIKTFPINNNNNDSSTTNNEKIVHESKLTPQKKSIYSRSNPLPTNKNLNILMSSAKKPISLALSNHTAPPPQPDKQLQTNFNMSDELSFGSSDDGDNDDPFTSAFTQQQRRENQNLRSSVLTSKPNLTKTPVKTTLKSTNNNNEVYIPNIDDDDDDDLFDPPIPPTNNASPSKLVSKNTASNQVNKTRYSILSDDLFDPDPVDTLSTQRPITNTITPPHHTDLDQNMVDETSNDGGDNHNESQTLASQTQTKKVSKRKSLQTQNNTQESLQPNSQSRLSFGTNISQLTQKTQANPFLATSQVGKRTYTDHSAMNMNDEFGDGEHFYDHTSQYDHIGDENIRYDTSYDHNDSQIIDSTLQSGITSHSNNKKTTTTSQTSQPSESKPKPKAGQSKIKTRNSTSNLADFSGSATQIMADLDPFFHASSESETPDNINNDQSAKPMSTENPLTEKNREQSIVPKKTTPGSLLFEEFENDDLTLLETETVAQKSKRGRASKTTNSKRATGNSNSSITTADKNINDKTETVLSDLNKADTEAVTTPKTRGRKPKATLPLDTNVTSGDKSLTTPKSTKTTRARKKASEDSQHDSTTTIPLQSSQNDTLSSSKARSIVDMMKQTSSLPASHHYDPFDLIPTTNTANKSLNDSYTLDGDSDIEEVLPQQYFQPDLLPLEASVKKPTRSKASNNTDPLSSNQLKTMTHHSKLLNMDNIPQPNFLNVGLHADGSKIIAEKALFEHEKMIEKHNHDAAIKNRTVNEFMSKMGGENESVRFPPPTTTMASLHPKPSLYSRKDKTVPISNTPCTTTTSTKTMTNTTNQIPHDDSLSLDSSSNSSTAIRPTTSHEKPSGLNPFLRRNDTLPVDNSANDATRNSILTIRQQESRTRLAKTLDSINDMSRHSLDVAMDQYGDDDNTIDESKIRKKPKQSQLDVKDQGRVSATKSTSMNDDIRRNRTSHRNTIDGKSDNGDDDDNDDEEEDDDDWFAEKPKSAHAFLHANTKITPTNNDEFANSGKSEPYFPPVIKPANPNSISTNQTRHVNAPNFYTDDFDASLMLFDDCTSFDMPLDPVVTKKQRNSMDSLTATTNGSTTKTNQTKWDRFSDPLVQLDANKGDNNSKNNKTTSHRRHQPIFDELDREEEKTTHGLSGPSSWTTSTTTKSKKGKHNITMTNNGEHDHDDDGDDNGDDNKKNTQRKKTRSSWLSSTSNDGSNGSAKLNTKLSSATNDSGTKRQKLFGTNVNNPRMNPFDQDYLIPISATSEKMASKLKLPEMPQNKEEHQLSDQLKAIQSDWESGRKQPPQKSQPAPLHNPKQQSIQPITRQPAQAQPLYESRTLPQSLHNTKQNNLDGKYNKFEYMDETEEFDTSDDSDNDNYNDYDDSDSLFDDTDDDMQTIPARKTSSNTTTAKKTTTTKTNAPKRTASNNTNAGEDVHAFIKDHPNVTGKYRYVNGARTFLLSTGERLTGSKGHQYYTIFKEQDRVDNNSKRTSKRAQKTTPKTKTTRIPKTSSSSLPVSSLPTTTSSLTPQNSTTVTGGSKTERAPRATRAPRSRQPVVASTVSITTPSPHHKLPPMPKFDPIFAPPK